MSAGSWSKTDTIESRFWPKINRTTTCWLWTGAKHPFGYGSFRFKGKHFLAHRLSFELTNGAVSKDLLVCHKCDNPPCVRPTHLFLGTYADNSADMARKGRHPGSPKLSERDVKEIRRLRKKGKFLAELAQRFNISSYTFK